MLICPSHSFHVKSLRLVDIKNVYLYIVLTEFGGTVSLQQKLVRAMFWDEPRYSLNVSWD